MTEIRISKSKHKSSKNAKTQENVETSLQQQQQQQQHLYFLKQVKKKTDWEQEKQNNLMEKQYITDRHKI